MNIDQSFAKTRVVSSQDATTIERKCKIVVQVSHEVYVIAFVKKKSHYRRTIIVVLRSVLLMMVVVVVVVVTRGGGGRCARGMKTHVRENHLGILQKNHYSRVSSDRRPYIGIQHGGVSLSREYEQDRARRSHVDPSIGAISSRCGVHRESRAHRAEEETPVHPLPRVRLTGDRGMRE